jgi:hypothetical protein
VSRDVTFEEEVAFMRSRGSHMDMEEYQSIMKNDVWDIVPRPERKSVVTSKWIYKIKHTVYGSIERHKTRFVARGFSQVEGIDYEETFSLVARYTSIWMIISPATSMG